MGSTAQPANSGTTSAVAQVAQLAEVSEEGRALLRPEHAPRDYVAALTQAELYMDAVRFLAYSIPKREAVWWAWFCARRSAGEAPPPPVKEALDATERWISQPTEENRRAAMAAAEVDAVGFGTAAGSAGLAAFLSGGSMAPPAAPVVPPGEYMTSKAVAGSVTMAALGAPDPQKAPERFRAYIDQGLDVARRIKLWEPVAP